MLNFSFANNPLPNTFSNKQSVHGDILPYQFILLPQNKQEREKKNNHNTRPGISERETQVNDNHNVKCTWRVKESRGRRGAS